MNNHRDPYDPEEEDLKKAAPTLFGLPRKENLQAPEGYFEGLAGRVKQRHEAKRSAVAWNRPRLLIPMAAAACVALFGFYLLLSRDAHLPVAPATDRMADMERTPAQFHVMEDVIPTTLIADAEIVDALDGEDDNWMSEVSLTKATSLKEQEMPQYDEEIISYLVANEIAMYDIIDELNTDEL